MKHTVQEDKYQWKLKLVVLLFFVLHLLLSVHSSAQVQKQLSSPKPAITVKENHLTVKYKNESAIKHLLFMIVNAKGRTIYLENRYNFSGEYNMHIDLRREEKGTYLVQLITDNTVNRESVQLP